MELTVKTFEELTTTELYEILKARAEIFVVEQKCVYQDVDDIDYQCYHMFVKTNKRLAAYLRAFPREDDPETIQLGRVLSIPHGIGTGGWLLHEALRVIEEELRPKRIFLEAQCYAVGFYEREGFSICTEEFLEDGIPHVGMERFRNRS